MYAHPTGGRMDADVFKRLCESAFDFLLRSAREIESEPKHALVSFAAGMELLLKARLLQEHWSLIVVGKPDLKNFKKGDFNSVGTKEALERLDTVIGEHVPKEAAAAFAQLIKHRNSVIHFFHELDGDRFQQAAAKDMCLGWMYLRARLKSWGPKFREFWLQIAQTDTAMKKVKTYLRVVFENIKPELEVLRKQGVEIAQRLNCSFEAAPVQVVKEPIWLQTCRVCALTINRVQIECGFCGRPHYFNSWDHFQPISCECSESISQDDVRNDLDQSDPQNDNVINCGECSGAGTVIRHNDLYICIECATYGEDVYSCEWCGEEQLNGLSLEGSYLSGCEQCDGRGMDD
jgi:hypothetical protein